MAKIWFVREGSDSTTGAPAYDDLPLEQCIERLGLEKKDWLHGLDQTPHFQSPRVVVPEYRHVVCQIDDQEAADEAWMAGYYLLEISPKGVARRLGPPEVS